MIINSYDTLVSAIQQYIEDDSIEFTNYIPIAIDLAELKLSRDIDTLGMTMNSNVTCTRDVPTLTKPSGFKIGFDVVMTDPDSGERFLLEKKTESYLIDYWTVPTDIAKPKFYSDKNDSTLSLAPTPDKDYTCTLNYQARPIPHLSASEQTNYFTEKTADALYYASLVEMLDFNKDFTDKQNIQVRYQEAVQMLVNQARRQRRDSQSVPVREPSSNNLVEGTT